MSVPVRFPLSLSLSVLSFLLVCAVSHDTMIKKLNITHVCVQMTTYKIMTM